MLTPTSGAVKTLSRAISVSASKFWADYSHHSPDYYAVLGVTKERDEIFLFELLLGKDCF